MLSPESRALLITEFQDSGIRPPDGAIPKIKTSAPLLITSAKFL